MGKIILGVISGALLGWLLRDASGEFSYAVVVAALAGWVVRGTVDVWLDPAELIFGSDCGGDRAGICDRCGIVSDAVAIVGENRELCMSCMSDFQDFMEVSSEAYFLTKFGADAAARHKGDSQT